MVPESWDREHSSYQERRGCQSHHSSAWGRWYRVTRAKEKKGPYGWTWMVQRHSRCRFIYACPETDWITFLASEQACVCGVFLFCFVFYFLSSSRCTHIERVPSLWIKRQSLIARESSSRIESVLLAPRKHFFVGIWKLQSRSLITGHLLRPSHGFGSL